MFLDPLVQGSPVFSILYFSMMEHLESTLYFSRDNPCNILATV